MPKPESKQVNPDLSRIFLAGNGTVVKTVERLPNDKRELESTIVHRFAETLAQQEQRHLTHITAAPEGKDPPDFYAREGAESIAVEITWAVHCAHAKLQSLRQTYQGLFLEELASRTLRLPAVHVVIHDNFGNPLYPHPTSTDGRQLVSFIVDQIAQEAQKLSSSSTDTFSRVEWDSPFCTGAAFWRVAPSAPEEPSIELSFTGNFLAQEGAALLGAVKRKIHKPYPTDNKLWLVVYELAFGSVYLEPDSPSILAARNLLASTKHPFDEVWYAYPYPHEGGYIERIWPEAELQP